MIKKRFISMLVLLMTAVTGAWAQEQSETIATTANIVEGTHFTISISEDSYADEDGMLADGGITVTSKNGETITKVVITCTCYTDLVNDGTTSVSSGTKEITNGGGTITVTGVNASTFTFTCSDDYPQFGQFVVYYTEASVAVTGVTLAPTTATLTLGETETVTLIPTVLPAEATDKSVTWSSSDEAVATVTDGVVTAVAPGTATITVTTTDGAKTATCAVTVAAPAASTYTVTWNNINGGTQYTQDGVTFTCSDYDDEYKYFVGPGTFTTTLGNFTKIEITAYSMSINGEGWSGDENHKTWTGNAASVPFNSDIMVNWSAVTFKFTIEPATVAVTGVTLAPTSATLTLGETETVTLIPTVLPAEATDKSVTWSSSNEAVATVTDGVVTAVAAGEATITVTTTDGAKTATCAVTVAAPAASTYTVTLKEGTEDATSWTIAPAEATTTGVAAGTEVKATYTGAKKVKSVKAKKKAPAAPSYDNTLNINTYDPELNNWEDVTVPTGKHWLITGTGEATTNVIIIANNATVTLSGVNITAFGRSIICEGNATIILADGTTNNLYAADEFGEAGIEMRGGSGTPLTIQGNTGVLNITSGSGPAIGAGYGHAGCAINIEGGIINATSTDGPGIGAAYNTACGNITISGGTVAATGGYGCPGIGGAGSANCGDITITNGVTSVTATKGSEAPYSIGASSSGSCGTVTIGGVVGAITESPYTYDPSAAPALLQVTVHESDWSQGSGDHIIYYASGETWAEAITNHPTENAGWSVSNNFVYYNTYQVYDGSDAVMADTPIDNGQHYEF